MFIKKLLLPCILFSILNINPMTGQIDKTTTTQHPSENLEHLDSNIEDWKQINDLYQNVSDQTTQIEFCLQTIEQIIHAGKVKINTNKTSKSELLEKIKRIKEIIQSISLLYTSAQPGEQNEAVIKGTLFNAAFIDALLPLFKNDINAIDVDKFDAKVIEKFKQLKTESNDPEKIHTLITLNNKNIETLIKLSENIGLSLFNKIYRYLDQQPLPISGKSTFSTVYDTAKWGGISLFAYGLIMYANPTGYELPGQQFMKTGTTNFANWLNNPNISKDDKDAAIAKNKGIGWYEAADLALRVTDNKLIAISVPLLTTAVMPQFNELLKAAQQKFNKFKAYYGQGDINENQNTYDYVKAYFKDIIGGQALEQEAKLIADYIKNPARYERAGNPPSTAYLLVGPSQTGKSFFARALRTLIDEQFEHTSEKVKFIDITVNDVQKLGFTRIFDIARSQAPIILFIDELDILGARRAVNGKNTQELLTSMNGMATDHSKKVIVIAATNRPEELDFALKQKGRFGNIITFDYPSYESRKQYLEKQLRKRNITLNDAMIDTIAQETDGQTYNMVDDIIRQALQLATYKLRPVQEIDFEMTLDKEIRKIKPNVTMSQVEKELIAIYQAGQATARHFLHTDQQIIKITIDMVDKPIASKEGHDIKTEEKGAQHENIGLIAEQRIKHTQLGYVFTTSKMNHRELLSDEEQDKELIALLSGQAALEIIKGKTFSEFGKEDRAKILDVLEKRISQGTPITDAIRQQAMAQKNIFYKQSMGLLNKHIPFIKIIVNELIAHHSINKQRWAELTSKE